MTLYLLLFWNILIYTCGGKAGSDQDCMPTIIDIVKLMPSVCAANLGHMGAARDGSRNFIEWFPEQL